MTGIKQNRISKDCGTTARGVLLLLFSHQLCLTLFATPWTVACQASLSMGFPRQEYWSELPFLSPGDLPNPGIKPSSPALAGRVFTTESPGKSHKRHNIHIIGMLKNERKKWKEYWKQYWLKISPN